MIHLRTAIFSIVTSVVLFLSLGLVWDSTFESSPQINDPISAGYARIQEMRPEIRDRLETEMDYGTINAASGLDTGRLHAGAARAFITSGTAGVDDCSINITSLVENDFAGSNTLDVGRLCVDTDDFNIYFYNGFGWTLAGSAFTSGNIVMRDNTTPCGAGWEDVTTTHGFATNTIRGADDNSVPLNTHIPQESDLGGAGTGECSVAVQDTGCDASSITQYDDFLDADEIDNHGHEFLFNEQTGKQGQGSGGLLANPDPVTGTYSHAAAPGGTKGDQIGWNNSGLENHYHPFKTVKFCMKL
jgi:hypothetical protein